MTTNENTSALTTNENTSAHWREKINGIEGLISTAQATLKNFDNDRSAFALAAATGDKNAASQIEKIRDAQKTAIDNAADYSIAMQQAREKLAEAERQEISDRQAAARVKAKAIIAERIEAAKRFDEAAAALDAAFAAYMQKGGEITRLDDLMLFAGRFDNVSAHESAFGTIRVKAALPATIGRLMSSFLLPEHRKLEESEISQWHGVLS